MHSFLLTPHCCSEALVEGLFIAFGWHYLSSSPPRPYLLPASRTNLCVFLLWASLSHSVFSWRSLPPWAVGGRWGARALSDGSRVCQTAHMLQASSFCEDLGNSWGEITLWIEIFKLVLFLFCFYFIFWLFIFFTGHMLSPMILAGRAWGWGICIRNPVQDCASGQLAPHCFVRWWLWSVGTKGTCRRSGSCSPNPLWKSPWVFRQDQEWGQHGLSGHWLPSGWPPKQAFTSFPFMCSSAN